ncbi:TPA: hypothetical protein GRI54_05240 [Vibrio parahaemolyticus]|uniref:hypothetical protein n=1 Tax=Vibrio TaxID=662 RepID=UPI001A2E44A4|nr:MULTISPECIES: hypothetical protein [Vibrio]HAS6547039.1 hypothetical protein [Vibrio parahaemolyticus]MCG9742090.1 hypothetical protein [Vibrio alginolyticus]MDW2122301.1 hypothetical protein [Vibrio sp. 2033]HAS6732841.1 hypothetical protein [Vibrio parahaemolyticus]HAS6846448.1 hypothetical protein [Vibrio parahaemolyticus]
MKFRQLINQFFPECDLTSDIITANPIEKRPWLTDRVSNLNELISWPPNIFLITYSIFSYTDKYRLLVSSQDHFDWDRGAYNDIAAVTEQLKQWVGLQISLDPVATPSQPQNFSLSSCLRDIFGKTNLDCCIYDLMNDPKFSKSVAVITAAIDQMFSRINVCAYDSTDPVQIGLLAKDMTRNDRNVINLSCNLPKLGYVTYKTSVPQSGLTINNLTQNLTFVDPTVQLQVIKSTTKKKLFNKKTYNVLFLPWPTEIEDNAFKASPDQPDQVMDGYFGFFEYAPNKKPKLNSFLGALISAIRRAGSIDLIVLPECAVDESTYSLFKKELFKIFNKDAPTLLAGVYGEKKNVANLSFIGETQKFETVVQAKHHRWFLDEGQLRNYNLSGTLDPGRKWWENIPVERRKLLTLHTLNGVKLCPLICEDLARQEPVAKAVRAIGPNLVVSLLLDGPQLSGRWPGKYSAVLSDDPGASVLSVTALGMTLRSTGTGFAPSRAVALWSEPNGFSETIEISNDGIGIVIELEIDNNEMWTIDGRKENKPVLRKKTHSTINLDENLSTVHKTRQKLMGLINRSKV